ncbi:SNF1-interacting protein [Apophysomyces sp. BC1021]|nr:SNF1-interacting protein [Apophysomyces sp. BC1021]
MPYSQPSFEPTLITLYDAVTDSPVYRANINHFDEQLAHLEKWIDSLSRHFKRYTELLDQLNTESTIICKRAVPVGLDEALIDPNITGAVMKSFSDAFQSSLTSKTKLASDLEANFIQPLQHLTKTHVKEFKDFRKEHQTTLEQYEAQLEKYSQNATKETSIMRDEAAKLYETRQAYMQKSGQHVMRILNLRSLLEHNLVESFSAATAAHKDSIEDAQIWKTLNTAMDSWRKWLIDDKHTCDYQLRKQQAACNKLENEYLEQIRPRQTLQSYDIKSGRSKWGYLFVQTSSHTWGRKWFFLHNGYFGALKPTSTSKIAVEDRVAVVLCHIRPATGIQRRFCFEIVCSERTYVLQAETEGDMREWFATFERSHRITQDMPTSPTANRPQSQKSRRSVTSINSDSSRSRSPVLVSAKAKSTTVVTTPMDIPVTLSTKMPSMSPFSNLCSLSGIMASSSASLIASNNSTSASLVSGSLPSHLTIVLVSTTPEPERITLSDSTSLTPLLVCEVGRSSTQLLDSAIAPTTSSISRHRAPSTSSPASWGIPLTFVPDAFENAEDTGVPSAYSFTDRIVWPVRPSDVSFFEPDISGYIMESKNMELRRLFGGVTPSEIVLDAFIGSLRKKAQDEDKSVVKHGYSYTGRAFVTQSTFWFYSCIMITCINTVAIRLKDIKEVRLIPDPNSTDVSKLLLALELPESEIKGPLVFSTLLDNVELMAQRLRILPTSTQNLYHRIHNSSKPTEPVLSTTECFTSSPISAPFTTKPHNQEERKTPSLSIVTNSSSVGPTAACGKHEPWRTQSEPVLSKDKPVARSVPRPADPDEPPAHIRVPKGESTCECDNHLERLEVQLELPIAAKRLYEMMFSDEKTGPPSDGGVWKSKTEAIAGHDLKVSKWQAEEEKIQRILSYYMPVSNPIVRMKEAEVIETQVLVKKQEYICYVVQISTKTAALPYADAFIPSVRYCITRVSRSRCKLAVYLGVGWVKSVMVRSIITKAALRGMADSVNVFIPILEESAKKIAADVEKERKDSLRAWKASCGTESEAPSINDKSDGSQTSVLETSETSQEIDITADYTDDDGVTDNEEATLVTSSTDNKEDLLKPPSIMRPNRSTVQAPKRNDSTPDGELFMGWVSKTPFYAMLCITGILVLCFTYLWQKPTEGAKVTECVVTRPAVKARAVYLRDLQEGILKKKLQPPYVGSKSFQIFLQIASPSNTSVEQYNWHHMKHYKLATELDMSRERVAILRHEILTMFQLLNKVDGQLQESEYMNWLLDGRLKCSDEYNILCDELDEQLYTFF